MHERYDKIRYTIDDMLVKTNNQVYQEYKGLAGALGQMIENDYDKNIIHAQSLDLVKEVEKELEMKVNYIMYIKDIIKKHTSYKKFLNYIEEK